MSKEGKNIYDLFNEVQFDINEENQIPMNDIEKKRIKNTVKSKMKKKVWWKNKVIVAVLVFIAITIFSISPLGREAIAAIKEKFFFNPGLGLVNIENELYVLKEPIIMDSENKEILIKGIISNEEGISIQLWINDKSRQYLSKEEIVNFEDIKKFIHINTSDGKELEITSSTTAGGSVTCFVSLWIESDNVIKDIGIQVYDFYKNVALDKVEEGREFYNIGGNDTKNNLFIGGNKYIFEDKTYITLWNDQEYKNNGNYHFSVYDEDIKVSNLEGKEYEVKHSDYGGNSKEFVINEKIEKAISVLIKKATLDYRLKSPVNIRLDIPKEGQTVEVNKEIYIKEIDERILLKSITSTEDGIEINFDSGELKKDNTYVVILGQERGSWAQGSLEDKSITLGIYKDDLTIIEKITGKINIRIKNIKLDKSGEWNFIIN